LKVFLGALDGIEESEFKREDTRESINEGLAHAKARGVRLGRPVKINAYREDVAKLRARGLSGRAISKALGGVSSSSVFKIIGQLDAVV
jgi:DNA invertase Pin-like site-specific DNA recombinase